MMVRGAGINPNAFETFLKYGYTSTPINGVPLNKYRLFRPGQNYRFGADRNFLAPEVGRACRPPEPFTHKISPPSTFVLSAAP